MTKWIAVICLSFMLCGSMAATVDTEAVLELLMSPVPNLSGAEFDEFLEDYEDEIIQMASSGEWKTFEEGAITQLSKGTYLMLNPEAGAYVLGSVGNLAYHDIRPFVFAYFDDEYPEGIYLGIEDAMKTFDPSMRPSIESVTDIFTKTAPDPVFISRQLIGLFMMSMATDEQQTRYGPYPVQDAITSIRRCYDVCLDEYGSLGDYSIEQAIEDAELDAEILDLWSFSVEGNPPHKYIAISTPDFPGGEGLVIWYDVMDACFHGYGIDDVSLGMGG